MSLPFTQRVLDPADLFFGTGRSGLFWSPDRSKFVTWGLRGAPGSFGYADDVHVWDNATRSRTAYVTGFGAQVLTGAGDGQSGFQPEAMTSDGILWGETFEDEHAFASFDTDTETGEIVSSAPGEIQFEKMATFACPDGHERVVVHENTTMAPEVWVYRPDNDTWETFAQPLPAYPTLTFAQDKFGDLWGFAATDDGEGHFWRFKEFGANSDTINDSQDVTGLSGYGGEVAFTPTGAVIVCDATANSWSGIGRYLVRLSGLNTNSWTVAQTKNFGTDLAFTANGFAPHAPDDTSVWLIDYRTDGSFTGRIATEIATVALTETQTVDLDAWKTDETDGDLESLRSFDYDTPALICTYQDSVNESGSISWRFWPAEDEGDDIGVDDDRRLRVWTYSLDDHDYYVLKVGSSLTLVYDLKTGQWAHWASPGRQDWRAHVGCNWVGMSAATLDRGFGSDVVAGDDNTGTLWVLDPVTGLDDNTDTGSAAYTRVVIGGIQLTGRDAVRCGAVQLTASLGNPSLTGATVTLRTSDDFGHNYVSHGALTVTANTFDQVLEWRACGLMRQPGRIFEISDNGLARISGLMFR